MTRHEHDEVISRGSELRTHPAPTERRGWMASVLGLLLGMLFIGSGIAKLVGVPFLVDMFETWGYGAWFMRVVGTTEVLGGVLVLIPAVRAVGAGLIAVIMIGAIATHVLAAEYLMALLPLAVLVGAAALVWPLRATGAIERPRRELPGERTERRPRHV